MNTEQIKRIQNILKIPLFAPSLFYGGIVNVRNFLYDKKVLKISAFKNIKVIGVGNIAVGGVGKTPVVVKLAQTLSQKGKVCVITGNYPTKDKRVNVVSIYGNVFKKPPDVPDEAYMIAKKTDAAVISSKSRKAAIELAIGLKCRYAVLDDALHKRSIKKDVEICVVDKNKPFENGLYLPAGMLRDAKNSINRCDFVICMDKGIGGKTSKLISKCNNAYLKPLGLFDNKQKKVENVKNVFAFCGIGNPAGFLKSLKDYGLNVKGFKFFKDHKIYSAKDIELLYRLKKEKNAEILVTTYKDFVKMENEDICYLDVEPIIEGFDEIAERIV